MASQNNCCFKCFWNGETVFSIPLDSLQSAERVENFIFFLEMIKGIHTVMDLENQKVENQHI